MRLLSDANGFVVSIELVLISTIAVIGLLAGMAAVRDATVSELSDVAGAVQEFNQGYSIFGVRGHSGSTAGFDFLDQLDFCDSVEDAVAAADNCIAFNAVPDDEA